VKEGKQSGGGGGGGGGGGDIGGWDGESGERETDGDGRKKSVCKKRRLTLNFSPPRGRLPFLETIRDRPSHSHGLHSITKASTPSPPRHPSTAFRYVSFRLQASHRRPSSTRPPHLLASWCPSLPLNIVRPYQAPTETCPPKSVSLPSTLSLPTTLGVWVAQRIGRSDPNMERFMHGTRRMRGHDFPHNGGTGKRLRLRNGAVRRIFD
jgi:hypothetical protein